MSRRLHLHGFLFAVVAASTAVAGAYAYAVHMERRALPFIASKCEPLCAQGAVLACAAFADPNLLPVYGGSELTHPVLERAPLFFERAPTGFQVFGIGKEGAMPLNMAQRLAAAGGAVHGRKTAILLSPTWFLRKSVHPRFYEGNFSEMQAMNLAYSPTLTLQLKRAAARQMLAFTATFRHRPILAFALSHLARATAANRLLYFLSVPLGRLQVAIMAAQDHFESVEMIRHEAPFPVRFRPRPREMVWGERLSAAEAHCLPSSDGDPRPERSFAPLEHGGSQTFTKLMHSASEWKNLEILFATLQQLHARPLVLSPPLNGPYMDRIAVSEEARALFYERLHALAHKYGLKLCDFRKWEKDPRFLADRHDHESAKGWIAFDRTLDAFYHHVR